MNTFHTSLSPEAMAMLKISAQHLQVTNLDIALDIDVQNYRQLWQAAQTQGDRQLLRALRQQVTHVGKDLQQRRQTPQNRMLWLDWLSLRCSMVIPRVRF